VPACIHEAARLGMLFKIIYFLLATIVHWLLKVMSDLKEKPNAVSEGNDALTYNDLFSLSAFKGSNDLKEESKTNKKFKASRVIDEVASDAGATYGKK
jgi:hypothetical protein